VSEYEGQPWDRQKGESEAAYRAFLAYRDLGPGRSREAAYARWAGHGKGTERAPAGKFTKWCAENDWVERARAWDDHLQAERDAIAAAEARKWEQRRQQSLEENWQAAQLLRDKARKMLAFPLQRTETEQDGKTVIIHPARWTFGAAARLLQAAADVEAKIFRDEQPDAPDDPLKEYSVDNTPDAL
jgi:hypothetical protein